MRINGRGHGVADPEGQGLRPVNHHVLALALGDAGTPLPRCGLAPTRGHLDRRALEHHLAHGVDHQDALVGERIAQRLLQMLGFRHRHAAQFNQDALHEHGAVLEALEELLLAQMLPMRMHQRGEQGQQCTDQYGEYDGHAQSEAHGRWSLSI